jgi:8-oxo-dGTP pyrophosphatase MutT (NUDIX family)
MSKEHHKSTRQSITSRRTDQKERPRIEVSAGGLVYKRTRRGLFFAMLKDSFGKWTFPKGHVRRGEAYEKGAEREIMEETGLREMTLKKPLGKIDIWFRDRYVYKGRLIHKFIHYYLFEAPPGARLQAPKIEATGERIHGVAWVPAALIYKRSNYKDMKPIIKLALDSVPPGPTAAASKRKRYWRSRKRPNRSVAPKTNS